MGCRRPAEGGGRGRRGVGQGVWPCALRWLGAGATGVPCPPAQPAMHGLPAKHPPGSLHILRHLAAPTPHLRHDIILESNAAAVNQLVVSSDELGRAHVGRGKQGSADHRGRVAQERVQVPLHRKRHERAHAAAQAAARAGVAGGAGSAVALSAATRHSAWGLQCWCKLRTAAMQLLPTCGPQRTHRQPWLLGPRGRRCSEHS